MNIDPNQYMIYTPGPKNANKAGKLITPAKKNTLFPSVMNKNLKAMKGFYEGGNFSSVDEGKSNAKKAGEKLSAGVSKSIKQEKKSVEEKPKTEGKAQLKDTYSREELRELRSKTKDDYGKGLVSTFHKGAETLEEHEAAQVKAYEALGERIEACVVKPDSINSEMLDILGLRGKPEVKVENNSQISGHISSELKELTDKGLIKKEEADRIKAEADKFTDLYSEAFPDASPQEVFEVVRDNSRKLAYQTERDKHVFSGSSHGTTHILEGNMRMADRMLEGLGDKATAKDKVLIHQIITDHDIGYTVGVAQAKGSFEASKDHPLFSTGYVEANKDYYVQRFGEDGYEMIKEGILQHSYPKSEYNSPTDSKKGFNPDMIRSITSTVDALGVTSEIKCPAFFREPAVVKVLQKVQLYSDTHDGQVSPEAMKMYTAELKEIANKETDEKRKEGFHNAIDNHFNARVPEFILGQYTGVLDDITLVDRDGKMIPDIKMHISKSQALLQNLFGDKMATKAFTKAMDDFGVSKEKMADMATTIRAAKNARTEEKREEFQRGLTFESDRARFSFGTDFMEISPDIQKVFEDFEKVSIRREIRGLIKELRKPEARTPTKVIELMHDVRATISDQTDEADLKQFKQIQAELRAGTTDPEKFERALQKLSNFTTAQERELMGIDRLEEGKSQ